MHQGSQLSACAIVKGTQRNLFVVPSSNTLEEEDLKSLQEAADADPSMKGQLMKKLHVSFTSMLTSLASTACQPLDICHVLLGWHDKIGMCSQAANKCSDML